jgi:hypothetical protein
MKRPNLSDYIKTPTSTTTSVNNFDYEKYCCALERYVKYLEMINERLREREK